MQRELLPLPHQGYVMVCILCSSFHTHVSLFWKVMKRRRNIFTMAAVPCNNEVAEARVSAVRPLKIGDYGFVYTKNWIMAAEGIFPARLGQLTKLITTVYLSNCVVFENGREKCKTCRHHGLILNRCCLKHRCAALWAHVWPSFQSHSRGYSSVPDKAIRHCPTDCFSHCALVSTGHSNQVYQLRAILNRSSAFPCVEGRSFPVFQRYDPLREEKSSWER